MWAKILAIVGIVVGSLIIIGCDRFTDNYTPDNALEEIFEEIIEQETGWDLDLTPSSPE